RDDGAAELRDAAHADRPAIEMRTAPFFGPRELAVHRRARHAEHEPARAPQRDLRGEERALAHEGLRAVDRIDQPETLRVERVLARLFAVEAVARKALA